MIFPLNKIGQSLNPSIDETNFVDIDVVHPNKQITVVSEYFVNKKWCIHGNLMYTELH